jgi:hypothetical protein
MRPSFKLVTLLFLAACSGNTATKSATPAENAPAARPNRDLITREQVDANPGAQDAYEVVQRLRPDFLRERGAMSLNSVRAVAVVYLDGVRRGGPEVLKTIRAQELEEIRFISATDATTRWGTDHAGGAIDVKLRHGR